MRAEPGLGADKGPRTGSSIHGAEASGVAEGGYMAAVAAAAAAAAQRGRGGGGGGGAGVAGVGDGGLFMSPSAGVGQQAGGRAGPVMVAPSPECEREKTRERLAAVFDSGLVVATPLLPAAHTQPLALLVPLTALPGDAGAYWCAWL